MICVFLYFVAVGFVILIQSINPINPIFNCAVRIYLYTKINIVLINIITYFLNKFLVIKIYKTFAIISEHFPFSFEVGVLNFYVVLLNLLSNYFEIIYLA